MLLAVLLAITARPTMAQDAPPEVRYRKAPQAANDRAAAVLKKFFAMKPSAQVKIDHLSDEAVICGPGLWQSLRNAAPVELQKAKPATFLVDGKQHPGKVFVRALDKKVFWLGVLIMADSPSKPVIRKARKAELQYLWAVVPWDIEEPVFVAQLGKVNLVFNFVVHKGTGEPRVFYVDTIGSVR